MRKVTLRNIVLVVLVVLLVPLTWLAALVAREEIVMRLGSRLSKPTVDQMNRHTLERLLLFVSYTDPSVRGYIDAYVSQGWSVNEATAHVSVEQRILDTQHCAEGFIVRSPSGRDMFRDPWGEPYDLRIMDGYLVLMGPRPGSEAAEAASRRAVMEDPWAKRQGRIGWTWHQLQPLINENEARTDPLGQYLYARFQAGQWAGQQLWDSKEPSTPLPIAAVIRYEGEDGSLELYFLDDDFAVTGLVVQGSGEWEGIFPGFVWSEGYRRSYGCFTMLRGVKLDVRITDGASGAGQGPATTQTRKNVPDVWIPQRVLEGKVRVGLVTEDGTRTEMIEAFVVPPHGHRAVIS